MPTRMRDKRELRRRRLVRATRRIVSGGPTMYYVFAACCRQEWHFVEDLVQGRTLCRRQPPPEGWRIVRQDRPSVNVCAVCRIVAGGVYGH